MKHHFKNASPLQERALTPNDMNKYQYRRQIVNKKFESLKFSWLGLALTILVIAAASFFWEIHTVLTP